MTRAAEATPRIVELARYAISRSALVVVVEVIGIVGQPGERVEDSVSRVEADFIGVGRERK
jgi:hypothetical protein